MTKSLGIFVTAPQHMRHLLGITRAATAKGAKVKVFLTFKAIHLTQCSEFQRLCELADVSICAASYKAEGYDDTEVPKGIIAKGMSTQHQHGDIVKNYDCYLTL